MLRTRTCEQEISKLVNLNGGQCVTYSCQLPTIQFVYNYTTRSLGDASTVFDLIMFKRKALIYSCMQIKFVLTLPFFKYMVL